MESTKAFQQQQQTLYQRSQSKQTTTMMMKDELLRKDQMASYFEKIQAGLKKEAEREAAQKRPNLFGCFTIGSYTPGISSSSSRGVRTRPGAGGSASDTQEKTSLFSSQCSSPSPPAAAAAPSEPTQSTSDRCLALLGIKPSSIPTEEEIHKSRLAREEEIMKRYKDITRIAEEKARIRPLVWDKPTFCPFGGETKSDDDADGNKKDSTGESSSSSSTSGNKRRRHYNDYSSPASSAITNLLNCSSSTRHNNMLLENCNMYSMMMPNAPSSSSVPFRTQWTKEEVDSFVEFTDKWILPKKKKIKVDHRHHDTDTTTSKNVTVDD